MLEKESVQLLRFAELEDRYGSDSAFAILRALEMFEGVREEWVLKMSREERFDHVIRLMAENMRTQTRH